MEVIRGRVARVLDEQQVAINLGSDQGVAPGDDVQLLRAVDVPDPLIEGESLGTAYVKKGSMIVDSVDTKFCIARVKKGRKPGNSVGVVFGPLEPLFLITERPSQDGNGRVYVQPADDYVDVTLDDGSEGE